jgi:hypothetical protein
MASGTLREFRVEQDVEYFGYEEKEELWLLGKSASGACTYRPQSVHDGRELSARGGGRFLSNGRPVWIESVPIIEKKNLRKN